MPLHLLPGGVRDDDLGLYLDCQDMALVAASPEPVPNFQFDQSLPGDVDD